MSGESGEGLRIDLSDGARLRALKESLNHAVEKLLGVSKASVFANCFPSLVPKNEAILESLRMSVIDKVREAIYEDLQLMIDDNIAEPLEQLGKLVKNCSGPRDLQAWRPSGNPSLDALAHDAKVLHHEKQRLVETLTRQQKISEELLLQVKAGRDQCENNSREIQNRLSVLSEVTEVCNSLPKSYMISYQQGLCHDVES